MLKYVLILTLMAPFTAHAQDQIMTVGIMPANDNPEYAATIMKEQVMSMKKAEGCLATTFSKAPIMSPEGPTDVQIIITSKWESLESFLEWANSDFAQESLPELKKNQVRMYFSEIE